MKRIIISVSNDLCTDQRVQRVCLSLSHSGYEVLLVGRRLPHSAVFDAPYDFHRMKLCFQRGFLFYASFNFRLFLFLFFSRVDILIANDLDTLPAVFLVSRLRRKPLLLDCHEYFPETPEVFNRPFIRNFWTGIERLFMRKLEGYYTVSRSIADIYFEKYKIRFEVIRNVPFLLPENKIINHSNLIIYQGSINMGRGLDLAIEAMILLPGYSLLIIGTGPELGLLKEKVRQLKLENQVTFAGLILPEALKDLTSQALIGLSLEESMGQSYQYCLPNKVFDYIQARVPILVSDLPEMRSLVEKFGVGEILHERTAGHLASVLKRMAEDRKLRDFWHYNLNLAANSLCWENEFPILLSMLKKCEIRS